MNYQEFCTEFLQIKNQSTLDQSETPSQKQLYIFASKLRSEIKMTVLSFKMSVYF